MSGSSGVSAANASGTSLTEAERTDARRFLGFPAYGAGNSGFSSWRFYQVYGQMEFRLSNLTVAEMAVMRQKMADLATLDAAILTSAANLDTDSAAVWTHNRDEVAQRTQLYTARRRDLAGFLGVPPGPALNPAGFRVVI